MLSPDKIEELKERFARKLSKLDNAYKCVDEHAEDRIQDLVWNLEEFVYSIEELNKSVEEIKDTSSGSSTKK